MYLINDLDDAISIVDPIARSVADSVPVVECALPEPQLCQLTALVLTPDATRAYVTQLSPGVVYVVDLVEKSLLEEIAVQQGAAAAVLSDDGTRLYVANLGGDSVSVIDTASNAVIDTIAVGDGPRALALTPDGSRLLVANRAGTISVIRTADGEVTDTVTGVDRPAGVAVSPNGAVAYVTNEMGDSVTPIQLSNLSVGTPIGVGENPRGVVFSADGTRAFVANVGTTGGADSVSVIDVAAGSVTGEPVTVGDAPIALELAAADDTLYVANLSDQTVSVVDTTSRAVESIPDVPSPFDIELGACPEGIGVTPTPTASPTPTAGNCTGDCNGDGTVVVNELIQGVNIALGNAPLSNCAIFDRNGDGMVGVNELIAAVVNASGTCPA